MPRTLLRAAFAAALATALTSTTLTSSAASSAASYAASTAVAPVATPNGSAGAAAATAECAEHDHADETAAEIAAETAGASARVRPGQDGKADTRPVSRAEQRQIDRSSRRLAAASSQESAARNSIADIPVYVHVMIGTNGAGNVTDTQIDRQVAVLNQTYGGTDVNGTGLDTGIRFRFVRTYRYVNNTWHQDKQSAQYRAKTRQGGKNALNIWLVDFDYLGIATFPWDYAAQPRIDGIRVQYSSLPGGSIANYNLGETATHEVGHWLGLFHTFQGGCADPGDSVADTPAQASPSSGCPVGRDSCPAAGADPVRNYMDYSYDSCYTTFSQGQDARMEQMWAAYRA